MHNTPRVNHWGPTANSQHPKGAQLGSHREFTKPQGCTIGVPQRIHKTPRVHHWGPTANSQNPKGIPSVHHLGPTANSQIPMGAPLGSHREFRKLQGCTIVVPPRIHKTPMVHHWRPTANSQNPKGFCF